MQANVISFTYATAEDFDLAEYGIGQGSVIAFDSDLETLTITVRRDAQVDEDQLEEFEEWIANAGESDPEGELGIVSVTVTYIT